MNSPPEFTQTKLDLTERQVGFIAGFEAAWLAAGEVVEQIK